MNTLILSVPRSGSTYLYTILYPLHDCVYSEPFRKVTDPTQFVNTLPADNVLIKSHYRQLRWLGRPTHDRFMGRDWNIIMLLRRNVFAMTISRAMAIHTGEYKDFTYGQDDIFTLNIYDVIALHADSLRFIADLVDACLPTPTVLYYEDLTFDPVTDCTTMGLPATRSDVQVDRLRSPGMHVVANLNILHDLCSEYMRTYSHPTIRYNHNMEITSI